MKDHNHMEKAKTEGIKIHVSEPFLLLESELSSKDKDRNLNKIKYKCVIFLRNKHY